MFTKNFPQDLKNELWADIENKIKASPDKNYVAAFDADGTLWDTDVSEAYFNDQVKRQINPFLKDLPSPLEHYKHLKSIHPPDGYLWLAQICKGQALPKLVESLTQFFIEQNIPLFSSQLELIRKLQSHSIPVYVVSASVEWVVRAALNAVGLHEIPAVGVKTQIKNSIITDLQDGPITWRAGKAEALRLATGNKPVLFASGNTIGDYELVKLAELAPLCIQTQINGDKKSRLFKEEQELAKLAHKNNWRTWRSFS